MMEGLLQRVGVITKEFPRPRIGVDDVQDGR